jgi:predicted RNA-binding Zn-ribbon protein involved in translation (DUF1610 family)
MSDKFSLQPTCSVCGTNLNEDEYGQMLMMAVGESIDLTCPKCGTVWRFWTPTHPTALLPSAGT